MINNDFQRCTSGAQFFNHVCLAKNGYHTGNLPPYSSKTSKRSGCVKPDNKTTIKYWPGFSVTSTTPTLISKSLLQSENLSHVSTNPLQAGHQGAILGNKNKLKSTSSFNNDC